jgi:hypothetical protein
MLAQGLGDQFAGLHGPHRGVQAVGQRLDAQRLALAIGEGPDVVLGRVGQISSFSMPDRPALRISA